MDALVARLREREETHVVRIYESREMLEYAAGLLHMARGHAAPARERMEQALLENAAAWFAHRGRAQALRMEHRPDEAAAEMAAALELAPDDAMLRYDHGAALAEARKFAEAAVQFRRATVLEPYWADAWLALGDAERVSANAPEALAAYEHFLALAPRRMAATVQSVRRQMEQLHRAAVVAP
jgi:Tfp pilus assembly protein PilF